MRWGNHKATTALLVYAGTGDLTLTTVATLGAVVPDAAEFALCGLSPHRGLGHWPYPYLVLAGACYWAWLHGGTLLLLYLAFFLVGALIHLLEDALSPGGIPWGRPLGPRRGLGLYVPFAPSEFFLALGLLVAAAGVIWVSGYAAIPYLAGEIERFLVVAEYFGRKIL
ncbi:metal-dependent hydrolase [Geoalkalibacter sp.]|uniref:metal-dependent hydrolase n=1 Tax=Geoalkalibacter sp. TaxID=3041440 RepID=UPI00272DF4FD|nr:metal-dependent hydrolase [Geoalkalibacter sp.]